MTTDDAGIDLPAKNLIQVKTRPSPLYWKFWKERVVSVGTTSLQEFELDSDFWGSNEQSERELIGDTSLTRRLYARQLCGLYNPYRYEAFRDLANSTDDRLIVFYNFTEEMERLKGMVKGMNRDFHSISGRGYGGQLPKGQQDYLLQPSPRLGTLGAKPKADSQDGARTPVFLLPSDLPRNGGRKHTGNLANAQRL